MEIFIKKRIPFILIVIVSLIILNYINDVIFHLTVEILTIIIALLSFVFARLSLTIKQNSFFINISPGLLISAIALFFHALAYPGMGLFNTVEIVLSTQLWLVTNYLLVGSFLYVFLNFKRVINLQIFTLVLSSILFVLLLLVTLDIFPVTYVVGEGQTLFKIISEYIFSAIYFGLAIHVFLLNKKEKTEDAHQIIAMLLTFGVSAILFTSYVSVNDVILMIAHIVRVIAFYIIFDTLLSKYVTAPLDKIFVELNSELLEVKQQAKQIRNSEVIFKSLYENAPVGYQSLNNEGILIHANDAYAEMLGYTKDELIGKWFGDLLNTEGGNTFSSNFEVFKDAGKTTVIIQMLHKNGTVIPVKFIGRIARNIDGTFNRTHCILMDITHDLEYQKSLIKNEEKLYSILDSTSEGIYGIDKDGTCTFVNSFALKLLGYDTFEDLIGKNMHSLIHHSYEDGTPYPVSDCPGLAVFETKENITISDEVFFKKDGSKLLVEYKVYPQYIGNEVQGVVVSFNDISERNRIIESLVQLSYQDTLTGLHNRRYYEKELKNIDLASNLPISIIVGDINGLKLVNDAFGHDAGDQFLMNAAKVLKKVVKNKGLLARIGGDEFVIVLPKTTKEDADKLATDIETNANKYNINAIKLSVSLGVAVKTKSIDEIYETYKIAEDNMYREKLHRIPSMRSDAIRTILKTLNEKDSYSEEHSHNVSKICKGIATKLQLPKTQIQQIATAGLLHDIGKIILPTKLLNKPGKLTTEEYDEIKKHPEIGYRILNSSHNMRIVSEYVLSHHEKIDGTGYPRRIKGDDIPVESKIICIADAYDAMTNDRTYKKRMTKEEAIKELHRCSGTQFDSKIVSVFIEHIEEIT